MAGLIACANTPNKKQTKQEVVIVGLSDTLKIPNHIKIDRLLVLKSKRQLIAYSNNKRIKTYRICLGRNPVGAKEFEGDMKTPEGSYTINDRNPNSRYYKNLGVSYPNNNDRKRAKRLGKRTGGDIKIHGTGGDINTPDPLYDWTWGCIAVTNKEIDELYEHVTIGSTIEIKP
ncbi:L,D-transpeptidase catalytic domain [compost metagenome]